MKKHINIVLLILAISISFSSCSRGKSKQQTIDSLQIELNRYKLRFGTLPNLQQEKDTNNIGIWEVSHYNDVFGDATSEKIVKNKLPFKGSINNTLDLSVYIYLDANKEISISFYEGNGNIEEIDHDLIYQVCVKDHHNIQYNLETNYNYDNRIWFPNDNYNIEDPQNDSLESQQDLMWKLLNSGSLRFYILSRNGEYRFKIDNPYFLDRAYRKMMLTIKK